jgi:putative FmdB family regulatory protein
MPTYQYACSNCDHEFEVVQSFSDAAIEKCPECEGQVRKKFGAVGVVFKGSGFYRTDSREKKKTEDKPKKDDKVKLLRKQQLKRKPRLRQNQPNLKLKSSYPQFRKVISKIFSNPLFLKDANTQNQHREI